MNTIKQMQMIMSVLHILQFRKEEYLTVDELQNQVECNYLHMPQNMSIWLHKRSELTNFLKHLVDLKLVSCISRGLQQAYKIELGGLCFLKKFSTVL